MRLNKYIQNLSYSCHFAELTLTSWQVMAGQIYSTMITFPVSLYFLDSLSLSNQFESFKSQLKCFLLCEALCDTPSLGRINFSLLRIPIIFGYMSPPPLTPHSAAGGQKWSITLFSYLKEPRKEERMKKELGEEEKTKKQILITAKYIECSSMAKYIVSIFCVFISFNQTVGQVPHIYHCFQFSQNPIN